MEPRSTIFFLDTMLTPRIITLVYWILLFVVIVSGFAMMFGYGMYGFSLGSFVKGIFVIVIGSIMIRIWCELLIVLFRIHENVQKIADRK